MARAPVAAASRYFTNRIMAMGAAGATGVGLIGYLLGSRPTTQTNEGVSNTTLMVIAGATVFVVWMLASNRG